MDYFMVRISDIRNTVFIGIPVCIVFAIMYFRNTNQKIKDEKL